MYNVYNSEKISRKKCACCILEYLNALLIIKVLFTEEGKFPQASLFESNKFYT